MFCFDADITIFFSYREHSMTPNRNDIGIACYRVPELHISARNLTKCMSLNTRGNDKSITVRIHLTSPKQRAFRVSLSGMGFNCSPVGGIVMSTVSNKGNSIWCKSLVGNHAYDDGLITCPYHCNCPDICSSTLLNINNMMAVVLCKIEE